LELRIEHGKRAALPFDILSVIGSPSLQRKAAEIFTRDKHPGTSSMSLPKRSRRDKIRIGYFSSDYFDHATCYLIAELFELHDRKKFEVFGFSFGPEKNDEMRTRVIAAMDQFLDVRSLSDFDVAQLCRSLDVDIAVDLKGFTQGSRTGIFAERAAPIQVNYLGFPGTKGSSYMDYLVADRTLIPESQQQHYSEKIVYLPDSYQVNDSRRSISDKAYTRAEEGLPEAGFVYCCFNNNYKITPGLFDVWMRILDRVEGSVLWLLEDNPGAGSNLRKEAARRGISPERLIFAERKPPTEHLARHRLADLFLDTFPYNAHTTASDALWAGLPVLTCMGESFASRVAASLLNAIHLPELVVTTQEAYEALAIEIAVHPETCIKFRERLQQNRLTTPLFDVQGFTRHLEAAYTAMYERYQADMKPEHIHVQRVHQDS
jgi:predicted O-linked N-acetylglucosamine transferase (SPINDLY family)